ncbi:putative PLC-like phosphodiesterase, TIM beta/alpha-barrel domain-containing protein [Lupinus albus]|uniref:Putative PLC-like phosphodiesterase, TIM beta/alpha-barrel domain-containing protein n=1 Tax=Lupinus albus TaxID=3870 RepID=A0A6A4QK12_LUPAL|nr:putative PLC-like phosphodiesterase, TIM beta/alpha-barrel domain-containing protein [Lupinus albus]
MCYPSKCTFLTLYFLLTLFSSLLTSSTSCSNSNCQVLEACSAATDCGPGLYCGNCPALGLNQPMCIRGQPTLPTSTVNGLPFNKYSWIVTHNSFSIVDAPPLSGVQRLTFYNQEDTVTNQLRNGVRGLMLDMYDYQNDIWLCHSFQGQCFNFTAFQPAINTLKEVEAFLTENPTEIVTIIIEDYVHTPKGLTNLFRNAGLDKYWFPLSKMPKRGIDWPTVTDMVQANHRLLVFTSDASKEAEEGIAYQWRHMVENESGDPGVQKSSCPHRKESKALNSKGSSLFLMNYFPTYPVEADSCKEHSAPLAEMVNTCYKAAGNMLPNFIAVNFYMRSDGGGVFDIVDKMNGHSLCGCTTVTACQVGAPFGSCKNISAPSTIPPINYPAGSFTGSVQFSKSASPFHSPNGFIIVLLFTTYYGLLTKMIAKYYHI